MAGVPEAPSLLAFVRAFVYGSFGVAGLVCWLCGSWRARMPRAFPVFLAGCFLAAFGEALVCAAGSPAGQAVAAAGFSAAMAAVLAMAASFHRTAERLRGESETDPLTGLANRRAFFRALEGKLAGSRDHRVAVAVIDLDGMKRVNDALGHLAGRVLRAAAEAVRLSVGECGLASRYGGDEFAVVFDAGRLTGAQMEVRLRRNLAACLPPEWADRIGFSMGVAVCPEDGTAAEELIAAADSFGALRPGTRVHVDYHCVANRAPNPGRYRMLYETRPGYRRLWRPGDDFHPSRASGKTCPDASDIPVRYHFLLEWYRKWAVEAGSSSVSTKLGPDREGGRVECVGLFSSSWFSCFCCV